MSVPTVASGKLLSSGNLRKYLLEGLMEDERSPSEILASKPQPKQEELLKACGLLEYYWGRGNAGEAITSRIGYGGAAYGAKTYGELILGGTACLAYPGIQVVMFRRKYTELSGPGGAMRDAHQVFLGSGAKDTDDGREWSWPNGSKFYFRHCENEKDVYSYLSQSFDILLIDEATTFTWFIVENLLTRNRVSGKNGIRKPFAVMTSNPGNIGHGMYLQLFDLEQEIVGGRGDRKHEQIKLTRNPSGKYQQIYFIPSFMRDNPIGLAQDPGYEERLREANPALADALINSNWKVFSGQGFPEFDASKHVIPPFDIPQAWPKWRGIDGGYNDPFCCLTVAMDLQIGRIYIIQEIYQSNLTDREQAALIALSTPASWNILMSFADPKLWAKKNVNGIVKSAFDEYLEGGIYIIQADNDRVNGKRKVHQQLALLPDGKPGLQIFSTCANLIRTLPTLAKSQSNAEDIEPIGQEDHLYDATRYLLTNINMFKGAAKAQAQQTADPWQRVKGI